MILPKICFLNEEFRYNLKHIICKRDSFDWFGNRISSTGARNQYLPT